jgi:hypothetical protein
MFVALLVGAFLFFRYLVGGEDLPIDQAPPCSPNAAGCPP